VLAAVAGILSDGGVSIATFEQAATESGARLVIGTHRALEQALRDTVEALGKSDVVDGVVTVLRVEGE
jgi:homoserine dehydrogenase